MMSNNNNEPVPPPLWHLFQNMKRVKRVKNKERKTAKRVFIQTHENVALRLKILAAKQGRKMHEIADEALTQWLKNDKQTDEMAQITKFVRSKFK